MAIRIGIVGLGKIAHDQHLPAIAASDAFELVAAASLQGESPRGPTYRQVEAMLAAEPLLDAVALCQPPQVRFAAARAALQAGKHVLLEKPPGGTLSEVTELVDLARARGLTLFAAWHSRYAPAVEPARVWLRGKIIRSVAIAWKEDVRVWHPGQTWIWQPGGLGVFDPGINALSIATHILPPFYLLDGTLFYPSNQAAPIAAHLRFGSICGASVAAEFDFRQTGPQSWDIRIDTEEGPICLSQGGHALSIDGAPVALAAEAEYPALYHRFADLIRAGESDVDLRPFRHVADAFLRSARAEVEPFIEEEAAPVAAASA